MGDKENKSFESKKAWANIIEKFSETGNIYGRWGSPKPYSIMNLKKKQFLYSTLAPLTAKSQAASLPIPLLAPVTITVFPSAFTSRS